MWYDNSCDTTKLNSDLLIYENWLYDTSVNKLTLFADIANVLKSELPPRTKIVTIKLLILAYEYNHYTGIDFYNHLEQPTGNVFIADNNSNRHIFYLVVRNYAWLMTDIECDTHTYYRVGMYEFSDNK